MAKNYYSKKEIPKALINKGFSRLTFGARDGT
jgi:hypothetical protein